MTTVEKVISYPWEGKNLPPPKSKAKIHSLDCYLVDRNFLVALQDHLRLKEEWYSLVDMYVVDNFKRNHILFQHDSRFEVHYIYFIPEFKTYFSLLSPLDGAEFFISLSFYKDEGEWFEREACEFFDVQFGRYERRNLLLPNNFPMAPLDKKNELSAIKKSLLSYKAVAEKINFPPLLRTGEFAFADRSVVEHWPVLPFYTAPYRMGLDLVDDKMAQVVFEVGHHHRGFEKLCETKTFQAITPFAQRLNYLSPSTNALVWCMNLENAFRLKIPERAMAMRMIYLELDRIREHCAFLSKIFSCSEEPNCQQLAQECWEGLALINQMAEGQKIFCTNITVGGIAREFPKGFSSFCIEVLKKTLSSMKMLLSYLENNHHWINLSQSGTLVPRDITKWFITGPNARASGINLDWRKDSPCYFYSDVEFEVPMGANGTVFDRTFVRIYEVIQSIHILFQILDNLPSGPTMVLDERFNLQIKETQTETKHASLSIPHGLWHQMIEAPNGKLSVILLADDLEIPYRVRWRGPSYQHFQLLQEMMIGHDHKLAQLLVASMGTQVAEIDR